MVRWRGTASWLRLLGAIVLCQGAGALGAAFTARGLQQWYPALKNPPNRVFGPVWTTLYLLMGIAEYLVTLQPAARPETRRLARRAHALFALQLGLNTGWLFVFFALRAPLAALVVLLALWGTIVLTILAFARLSRLAALLLVPYLLWSTFAAVLNGAIWWLNRKGETALSTRHPAP
jgi:benzodiazapine receptor